MLVATVGMKSVLTLTNVQPSTTHLRLEIPLISLYALAMKIYARDRRGNCAGGSNESI